MKKDIIPKDALKILCMLKENGYEAYLVGGCVRDMYMDKMPNDWDITTSALPDEILSIFKPYFPVIEVGKRFGTIAVIINKTQYEVTTYRSDNDYKDSRHPQSVSFVRNLREDLLRRDFTMNTLCYNEDEGFVDLLGGKNSIATKTIECVGSPDKRFNEDALRIMRAIRFSAQLGFKIEENTALSIKNNAHLLKNISFERINTELCKILLSKDCGYRAISEYKEVFVEILPELDETIKNESIFNSVLSAMQRVKSDTALEVRLAILFYNLDDIESVLKTLKFSNSIIDCVKGLINCKNINIENNRPSIKRLLNRLGIENSRKFIKLTEIYTDCNLDYAYGIIDDVLINNECYLIKDLNINGSDLISLGVEKGNMIGRILEYLLDLVIDGKLENKSQELMKAVKKIEF